MGDQVSIQKVREAIELWMVRNGLHSDLPTQETLLIRNGFFCGHRFLGEKAQAIWFVEEGQIKLFGKAPDTVITTSVQDLIVANGNSTHRNAA